ncbi:MAG TPA: acyltransferase domain-containing protein [Terriglobales bacterium]|nr:acyltransferase domain-containing protein [Terriglobales bacterium]
MLALLCGGQGRVSAEMFDLAAALPEADAIFKTAEELLGSDPRKLVKEAEADILFANRANQILSVTAALANYACIMAALPSRMAVTGYSVGEMAAWSIAGIWSPQTALRLTALRAQAMDAADGDQGQLGYIRGPDRAAVETFATRHHCTIAIVNPGNLHVVGGLRADVTALCQAAEQAGAQRAALLDVRIASHTPRLAAAVPVFHAALRDAGSIKPRVGCILLSGGDGSRIFPVAKSADRLAAQIADPIDWAATLEALVELGVDHVLDLGPGHALADMMHGAYPDIRTYAVDGFRTADGLRHWLGTIR